MSKDTELVERVARAIVDCITDENSAHDSAASAAISALRAHDAERGLVTVPRDDATLEQMARAFDETVGIKMWSAGFDKYGHEPKWQEWRDNRIAAMRHAITAHTRTEALSEMAEADAPLIAAMKGGE